MSYRPKEAEQMAVQAKLASRLGSREFLSLFADLQILDIKRGTLKVRVGSPVSARIIESIHGGLLAVVVESVVKKPVKSVNVVVRAAETGVQAMLDRSRRSD